MVNVLALARGKFANENAAVVVVVVVVAAKESICNVNQRRCDVMVRYLLETISSKAVTHSCSVLLLLLMVLNVFLSHRIPNSMWKPVSTTFAVFCSLKENRFSAVVFQTKYIGTNRLSK